MKSFRALCLLAAGMVLSLPAAAPAQFPGDSSAKPGPPEDPTKAIQKIDGTRFKLGTMEFDQKTREVRIPCKVNMREGLLEYVLVHETGKVHESLFSTAVKPFELNVVLLLLNWKKSDVFFDFSQPERGGVPVKGAVNPPSSQVEVWVEWKDQDGKMQNFRVENWLHQIEKKAKITTEPFIYTSTPVMPDGSFLAEQTGSILGLYVDPGCLVNNPRDGNDLDDVWVNDPAVPAKGTPVTLIFKPVAGTSLKQEETKPAGAEKTEPEKKPAEAKPAPTKGTPPKTAPRRKGAVR
ncbi:MAG TPA: YdjY domain-containing protein [Verrucomicrobiales bacterium]|jgi:hypothetical protein|nr:YdjY domain-containing protein [Verrucomicrobiales bacterium]